MGKKIFAVFAVLLCLTAGILFAEGTTAHAAEENLTTENASLFLPGSYEQYLTFESATDIAFCGRYVAIAEKSTIYIIDRKAEQPAYHTYTHERSEISKIQFSDEEKLYFSDRLLGFYELDLTDLDNPTASENQLTSLTTFLINGDELIKVSVTSSGTTYQIASLSKPNEGKNFGSNEFLNTPQLAYTNGEFYSIVGELVTVYTQNNGLTVYDSAKSFSLGSNLTGLKSACAIGDTLYYTISGSEATSNGLYAFTLLKNSQTLLLRGNGFGALTSYGGKLYCVKGNGVLEFEPTEDGLVPTSYEISSSSSSEGRLSGATDIARGGDLLVTADTGNSRLSVCHMDGGTIETVPLTYAPTLVATDGSVIAAAAGKTVCLYERGRNGFELTRTVSVDNSVSSITCLYGKCYFLTLGFGYGVIDPSLPEPALCIRDNLDRNAPSALCSDLYGALYAVRSDGSVFTFTEDNFTDPGFAGSPLSYTLPAGFTSVRADFEGNLYCLDTEGVLYRNGERYAAIDGADHVYSKDDAPLHASSFALGFEDDEIYFCFGNFTVKTDAGVLGFPTLSTIDASEVYGEVFNMHEPGSLAFVDVKEGAVGIEVDLSSLHADDEFFSYASYSRTESRFRGVLLAEKGDYRLVALYHDRAYDVRLYRAEQCTPVLADVKEESGTAYLVSNGYLYNYPCFTDAKSASPLARGTQVKVLSLITADPDKAQAPDYGYDFAFVEYEGVARESVRGYLPASFLTEITPMGKEPESYLLGYLKKGKEADLLCGGRSLHVTGGQQLRLTDNGDGTYTARVTGEDGSEYSAVLDASYIDWGESDAWRIALIIGLTVLAVLIVGVYVWLVPWKKKMSE